MNQQNCSTYLVVGSKSWSRRIFHEIICSYPGRWSFIEAPERFTFDAVKRINPRYIFFLHWSWKVPRNIIQTYECIGFHMTDLPFGRGGTPLQNLIDRGIRQTQLTAFRMTSELDAGPVYLKKDLSLEGGAEEIYIRASTLAAHMIKTIIHHSIKPVLQKGKVVVFKRRTPEQSEIPEIKGDNPLKDLGALFDFLRMLDAEGYPHAFLTYQGFRYEFTRPALYTGRISADVTITPLTNKNK